LLFGPL